MVFFFLRSDEGEISGLFMREANDVSDGFIESDFFQRQGAFIVKVEIIKAIDAEFIIHETAEHNIAVWNVEIT